MDEDRGQNLYRLDKSWVSLGRWYFVLSAAAIAAHMAAGVVRGTVYRTEDWAASCRFYAIVLIIVFVAFTIHPIFFDRRLLELYRKGILVSERREGPLPFEMISLEDFVEFPPGKKKDLLQFVPLTEIKELDTFTDAQAPEKERAGGLLVASRTDGTWVAVHVWKDLSTVIGVMKDAYGPYYQGNIDLGPEGKDVTMRKKVTIRFDDVAEPPKNT
jgi:hypothetical protein